MASFDEAIPPGQAGKINATLKTSGYRGAVTKTITVTTNDPAQGSLGLALKARVVGSVELLPIPSVTVSAGGPEARPGRILIRKDATEAGDFKFANMSASLPWLQVTSRVIAEPPSSRIEGLPEPRPGDVIIEVTTKGDSAPTGSFQGTISFETGLAREPQVSVPVYVYVRGPLTLGSKELILHPGSEGIVLVGLRSDVTPESVTAKAEPAAFKATLERANASALRLKVSMDESNGPAPATGTVTIAAGEAKETLQLRVVR